MHSLNPYVLGNNVYRPMVVEYNVTFVIAYSLENKTYPTKWRQFPN